MKKFAKIFLSLLCASALALPVLAACGGPEEPAPAPPVEAVDYVSRLKLDLSTNTKKQEVIPKIHIDGDTTHFTPKSNVSEFTDGIIKARYLAVNTPESTGTIEKWGKTASNFTHDKLWNAEAVLVESDDENWNLDSTSSKRLLLWVWYVPKGMEVKTENYRNLNVELLQEGYGRASSTAENRYGEIASAALAQAQQLKLKVFGNEKDVNFFGGAAVPMTLKYLRFHLKEYVDHRVSVTGVVTAKFGNCAYIEELDEDGVSYGMCAFYGYKGGELYKILTVGNTVNVVGKIDLHTWEYGDSYQLTDLDYNEARPNASTNTTLVEAGDGKMPSTEMTVTKLTGSDPVSGTFTVTDEDGNESEVTETLPYKEVILCTSVTLKNLTVTRITVTTTSTSNGAMSIYCTDESGKSITLRTEVLTKADNTLYTPADVGAAGGGDTAGVGAKIASVNGIVDEFSGSIQIAVYDWSCLTFAPAS